jgi:N-acetyl-anhydromuramyl-L-alanine amidase AmpD
MVQDKDRAYHCSKGCNSYSIGIEHIGLIDVNTLKVNGGFSLPMYRSSAQLSAWLCQTYGIIPTRDYVLAHSENAKIGGISDHVDPGIDWDWNMYMTLIR